MLPIKTLDVKDAISIFEAVKYVAKEWELPLYIQNKTTQEKIAVDLVEFGRMLQYSFETNELNDLDKRLKNLVGPYIINGTTADNAAYYSCYMYHIFLKAAAIVSRYKDHTTAKKDNTYISFRQEYNEAYNKTMEYYDVCDEYSRFDQ